MKQESTIIKNLNKEKKNYKGNKIKKKIINNNSKDLKDFSLLGKKSQKKNRRNSLGDISREFLKYIGKLNTNIINLNEVVKSLKIKKRRIYDITNVMEGKLIFLLIYYIFFFT